MFHCFTQSLNGAVWFLQEYRKKTARRSEERKPAAEEEKDGVQLSEEEMAYSDHTATDSRRKSRAERRQKCGVNIL